MQVGEQIRQVLSDVLREGILKDPRLESASLITITEVKMTPDLKLARVYASIYGTDADPIIEALNAASRVLQRELADRLELRYTPKLEFGRDDSIAYGAKIEALLSDIASEARGPQDVGHPARAGESARGSEQSERSRVAGLGPAGTRGIREDE